MRTCPKCGSYVPDGKLLCISCNRPVVGLSANARQTTLQERNQTRERITEAFEQTERKGFFRRDNLNPYKGNTYEQHRSHDPNSKDYYRSKYQKSAAAPMPGENIICLFAYLSFFFFLPLVLLPNSKFARFHANQGLVLFLFSLAMTLFVELGDIFLYADLYALNMIAPMLMLYGIVNCVKGDMKELPIIGKLQLIKDNTNLFGGLR